MDQVHVVRHKVLVEGRSYRQVAREMDLSRNTVRRYVEGGVECTKRATVEREKPAQDRVRKRLEQVLEDSPRWTGGKQRLTASRLHEMLQGEGHEVGYTVVKQIVAEWKRRRQEVFVPLVYRAGELAEVDFFEVLVDVRGKRRKAWMFVMRMMFSGRDFAWLYERQDQVSFLDAHVRAFEHFGCVPQRIVYDNLKPAVARVLAGSERVLAARFLALVTHYVFEASFARPATGHDKGGGEARGKAIRRQELVPIPSGETLGAMSSALLARLDARTERVRDAMRRTIAERFIEERAQMLPMPAHRFEPRLVVLVEATRRALVRVHGAYYSVPSRWAGLSVSAYVGPAEVEIIGPDGRALHPRMGFGERSIDYRHYLSELAKKPQAVRQVASELVAQLGAPFDRLWRQLVDEVGPREASRVFARVLGAIESLGENEARVRVTCSLEHDENVLLALRPAPKPDRDMPAESLPHALAGVDVATSFAADYDQIFSTGGAR